MPTFTIYFAQLAGLYFIILGVILVLRKRTIIDLMPKMADDQPFVFLTGMIRIIIGLATLIGNGPWGSQALGIVVALIGWITLIRGIAMLLVTPEQQRRLIDFWRRDAAYYVAALIVLVLASISQGPGSRHKRIKPHGRCQRRASLFRHRLWRRIPAGPHPRHVARTTRRPRSRRPLRSALSHHRHGLAARWIPTGVGLPRDLRTLLAMGLGALILQQIADFAVGIGLRRITLSEQLARFATTQGLIYAVLLILFCLMPALLNLNRARTPLA
jgi:hypothetical protein